MQPDSPSKIQNRNGKALVIVAVYCLAFMNMPRGYAQSAASGNSVGAGEMQVAPSLRPAANSPEGKYPATAATMQATPHLRETAIMQESSQPAVSTTHVEPVLKQRLGKNGKVLKQSQQKSQAQSQSWQKAQKSSTKQPPIPPVQLPPAQPIEIPAPGAGRNYPPPPQKILKLQESSPPETHQIFDADAILLKRPPLTALIQIERDLSPIGLDAQYSQPMSLRDALIVSMDNNLDLALSQNNAQIQKWTYLAALSKFLPDLTSAFSGYESKGEVALPIKAFPVPAQTSGPNGVQTANGITKFKINSPFVISNAGFKYYGYRGGSIVFGAIQSKHNLRAARSGLNATRADVLLTTARDYYNLVLAHALLEIRVKAADTSEEQIRVNTSRFENGFATNLDVLQSRTQLSRDRQGLVDQQVNCRAAAIQLADTLNVNLAGDLTPYDDMVRKVRLVDANAKIQDLLKLAIDHRPELKQYDELRQAAKAAIIVNQAPLQPKVALVGNVYGLGPGISKVEALYTIGFNANWNFGSLGTTDLANIKTARLQARQAMLQANKELLTVCDQARLAYIQSLDAEKKIDETSNEVASATEELRLAQMRFENGLGTNLDIITAQRDRTQALIDKAQAIINFNIAQAQLVHDLGMATVDSLSGGRLINGQSQ